VSATPADRRRAFVEAIEHAKRSRPVRPRDTRLPDEKPSWWQEVDRLIAERRRREREGS
jgi:hypothetical protein